MESGQVQLCLPERPSIPAFSPYRRQCVATPLETTQWLQPAAHLLLGGCSSAHCWDLHHGSCNLRFTFSANSIVNWPFFWMIRLPFMVVFWRDYDIFVWFGSHWSLFPNSKSIGQSPEMAIGFDECFILMRSREKAHLLWPQHHGNITVCQISTIYQNIL